ncbi:hypothetical protein TrVFT333_005066 [Trichoderma virens FT-333]|nr:hypothetical protein TrVFT333_005066 [Trichoderma virens FT-333]
MIKTSVAIAALSAGGGAALTAALYSLRPSKDKLADMQPTLAPSSSSLSSTAIASSSTAVATIPASQVFGAPGAPSSSPLGSAPVNPGGLFEYGFPGPVSDIASRAALISSYDRRTRNPTGQFLEDTAVPAKFRALLKDYYRSGYDRGHQVPAADAKWSQAAMDETFYLTNMSPQVGEGFNRDYWAHFEDFCRRLTQRYPSVRIVTGPLYLPKKDPVDNKWYVKYEMIGTPPSVAVPTHFYKVIFAEDGRVGGNVAIGAFVLPNAPIDNAKPITDFEVPVEAVERASGLEFANQLPMQRRRRLCADTTCSLIIKDYNERQKSFAKGRSSSA